MRHPLTTMFIALGLLALAVAILFPMWPQVNAHSIALHPNGYQVNERQEHPFAITGAGFAILSGLCFLSAALVNMNPRRAD